MKCTGIPDPWFDVPLILKFFQGCMFCIFSLVVSYMNELGISMFVSQGNLFSCELSVYPILDRQSSNWSVLQLRLKKISVLVASDVLVPRRNVSVPSVACHRSVINTLTAILVVASSRYPIAIRHVNSYDCPVLLDGEIKKFSISYVSVPL
jgi:hypothetical protein